MSVTSDGSAGEMFAMAESSIVSDEMPTAPDAAPSPLTNASMTDIPPADEVKRLVKETFPEDSHRAERILACESSTGQNPDAYNPTENNAGPMQINRWWEPYLQQN